MLNTTEISVLSIISIVLLISLADVWMNKNRSTANKVVYSLAIILLPILGCVAYWLVLRKQPR